jgi:hypothetical protein
MYGPIKSVHILSHGLASASIGNIPHIQLTLDLYLSVLSIRDKECCLEANQFKDTMKPLVQSNFSNYNF